MDADYTYEATRIVPKVFFIGGKKYHYHVGGMWSFYCKIVPRIVNSYSLKQSLKLHERRQESETEN